MVNFKWLDKWTITSQAQEKRRCFSSPKEKRKTKTKEKKKQSRIPDGRCTQAPTYISAATGGLSPSADSPCLLPKPSNNPRKHRARRKISPPPSAPAAGGEGARHGVHGSRRARPLVAFPATGAACCGPPRHHLRQSGPPNPTVRAAAAGAACGVPSPSSPGPDCPPPRPPPPRLPRRGGSPPQLFPRGGEPPAPIGGPIFVGEIRSHSGLFLVTRVLPTVTQFLKDEGAVPSPEDEKRREEVIRELKKVNGVRDVGSKKETCEFGALPGFLMCSLLFCFRLSLR